MPGCGPQSKRSLHENPSNHTSHTCGVDVEVGAGTSKAVEVADSTLVSVEIGVGRGFSVGEGITDGMVVDVAVAGSVAVLVGSGVAVGAGVHVGVVVSVGVDVGACAQAANSATSKGKVVMSKRARGVFIVFSFEV